MDIPTWTKMVKIRDGIGRWLPDLPVWKSSNHYVEKSYFRNEFRWDGEYVLDLPLESEKDVAKLMRHVGLNPPK